MRFAPLFVLAVLAACASKEKEEAPYPAAQAIIDEIASRHSDLVRLTLHAVPKGKTECTQIASTVPERRGKRSDPEDREAMRTGKQIVLDEAGAVDVTVPILIRDGAPTAIAGVTVNAPAGADRDALVRRARAIAEQVATEVRVAGKPLW
jgi:hypothetical protein